ncbi:purine nucleoside phosphorylase [Oribacterium asaccharolyticum ACB7]|jgi:purine nucleoside phosphorylase|uniref:Purine nucleoside phosphorylase DeoD-type n=1 Tax=Oribacterium asaccharolyticum ACB7 TaxID=796944 RepID=G9WUT7_9FIRM|nr:purine-nucleoside phosphorylase [Oribacterium asaccharolyticum]EHL11338.1 purine nucleoside phosphorylase [Oribacterium asaccharolyticum ACB7]
MGTAHNKAEVGDIAKTVLMPGDPLRAKYIAETYLTEVKCFNSVRNMLGFTGKYNGKEISVMGSGMGMPSIGIYSYELYQFYNVESIIRIGSAGALHEDIDLKDIVFAQGACTDSRFAYQYELPGSFAPIADFSLLEQAVSEARALGTRFKVGNVVSSDIFYNVYPEAAKKWAGMGVLCVEMEAAALYMNAAKLHKKALAILSISDHILKGTELSPEERQTGFSEMMEIALKLA